MLCLYKLFVDLLCLIVLHYVVPPAASASVLFGTAQSVLCLCVFVCVCVHQIKVVEHHNWLLHHHFSDMRLATERQMQRHSPLSQRVELALSIILNWHQGCFGQTVQWLCCLHISTKSCTQQ